MLPNALLLGGQLHLQGRRVDEAQKGIFIEDGKKIVRK